MIKQLFTLIILAGLFSGCNPSGDGGRTSRNMSLQKWPIPAEGPSGEPNLFVAEDGRVYLSWIEYVGDSMNRLVYATLSPDGRSWTEPFEIARGDNWFVNWADFPSLAVYPGGEKLAAHWLAKNPGGNTYDYNVMISQSVDSGRIWEKPLIPHTDGKPAEHGFVSLLPLSSDRMMAVWLDGRFTSAAGGHDHGGAGAMTLRTATLDPSGALFDEAELDHRICDCCQTDAALTSQGPIVVYRDRSEEEVRDIYLTRRVAGQWTPPRAVFADNWRIAACPVNGPAIDAVGDHVVVAWFSAPGGEAQVKVAFSGDAGATMGVPQRIDDGRPAGRVDVILLAPDLALVSWLENKEQGADIRLAKVGPGGIIGEPVTLVATSESRRSGFPVLARGREEVILAWTQLERDGTTRVRVGKIQL